LKKSIKISQKLRKRISLFLLLNFLSYTLLLAFPQKECDGLCEVNGERQKQSCSQMMDRSCCDMFVLHKHQNSHSSDTKIKQDSCNFEYLVADNNTFIVPKVSDSKVELTEISAINLDLEPQVLHKFIISQNLISDVSPPIYITVSSFLI
jgi:hypothetical protein